MTRSLKMPSVKVSGIFNRSNLYQVILSYLNFSNHFISRKIFLILLLLFGITQNADSQVCGTSGIDGPKNALPPVNTYFPLGSTATLVAGSKSITLLAVPPNDPNYNLSYGVTPIKSGDLILIIQMQDATFDYANSNLYGNGSATSGSDGLGGTGYIALGTSGKFEYVVATSNVPLTGGLLTFRGAGLGSGSVNTYTNAGFTATRGQRRFQVVRVPQYSNLILNSTITTPPYNGSVGGLIAFDVAGTMQFNGFIVDASERGFRGGYGPVATSGTNINSIYAAPSSSTRSVGKGEGIAGTPRYMWDGFNQVDNLTEGLPGGSYGRGAPANAGGAGNDHNAGGGGGGNGGFGGVGGRGWQGGGGNLSPLTSAGRPGSSIPADVSRLIMGGGGGGGDANNATSGVKGGVGGGIILINVEKIEGVGIIKSNGGAGQAGAFGSNPDGAGGGGAGGSIFVRSLAPCPTANLTLEAKGGNGGNTKNDAGNEHGPGGGGGGGQIYTQVLSATVLSNAEKGLAGKANNGAGITHGAANGDDGNVTSFFTSDLPSYLQGGGSICYPILDVTLIELNAGAAGIRAPGTTATYKLIVKNNIGGGNAGDVKVDFQLPFGFSLSTVSATLTGDAAGPTNPSFTVGTTGIISFGSYNISPGDQVEFTIIVNIASNVPSGIYHASAQATHLDPTRTNVDPLRKITANNNPFVGSYTNYETGGIVNVPGTNYNGDLVTAFVEDVYINGPPVLVDCNAIINGDFSVGLVGEYGSPNYFGRWSVVNPASDKVKIVSETGLQGALIGNNGTDYFSIQQTINYVKPSTSYTLTFDYRNWTDGCGSPSASKSVIEILDANSGVVIVPATEYIASNSPQVATISFNTLATTSALILKIKDSLSPNPACGTFIDNITLISPLNVQTSKTDVSCKGGNDGTITISSLSGAAAPYQVSYSFNGGPYSVPVTLGVISTLTSSYTISNLVAGTYTLKILDENECSTLNFRNISIDEPTILTLTGTNSSILCNGGLSTVTVTAGGGTAPYQYSIDGTNFQVLNTFPDLTQGNYTFTVVDANSCRISFPITITQPVALTLTGANTTILCNGGTSNVTLSASGGTGSLQYSLDGIVFQASNIFNGVLAGPQTFTVKDGNDCIKTVLIDLVEPSLLSLTATNTAILCNGGSATVSLNASGGISTYQYSKDGVTYQSSNIFTSQIAGNYTFYVKDANNCIQSTTLIIIEPAVLAVAETHQNINCFGDATGSIDVTISGGTLPYTFTWTNGETALDQSNLAAGSYTLLVTDANNCTISKVITITQPLVLAVTASKFNVKCFGETTGSINVTISGGVAPYTYNWSNGATTEDLINLAAGSYSLEVTDSNGCLLFTPIININQPVAALTLSETHINNTCFAASAGSIDLTVSGGVGPYLYSWSSGQTTQDIANLTPDNYTVTVTDANSCTSTKTITITPLTPFTLSSNKVDVNCNGAATGEINLNLAGGTLPYTIIWNNGATTANLQNLIAGTYSYTATDNNGCVINNSVTIIQPTALTLTGVNTDIFCANNTSNVTLTASGGTGIYQYSIDGTIFQSSNVYTDLLAGDYAFAVKDANNCIKTFSITISEPTLLTLTGSNTSILCSGETSSVTLTALGGTGVYQYSKDGVIFQSSNSFTGLKAGNHTFTVKDANNCVKTFSTIINEPTLLTLTGSNTDILCSGGTSDVTLTASGGTGVYQYSKDGITFQAINSFTGLTAGQYVFTVKDANNCIKTFSIIIIEPIALNLTGINTAIQCNAGISAVTLTATGGSGANLYSNDGIIYQPSNQFNNLTAGTYTFYVKDVNACQAIFPITITEPAALTLAISTKTDATCNATSTGSVTAGAVNNAVGTINYSWKNSSSTEVGTTATVNNLPSGVYTLTVTDNCFTKTNTVTIGEPSVLVVAETQTNIKCFGEATGAINISVTGGTAPYTYSWSNSSTTEDINNLIAGTYTVNITDVNGCAISKTITITQPIAPLSITETQTNINCFGEATGAINISVIGGTAPYTYSWSNSSTTEDINNLTAGIYTVIINDANGCAISKTITITQSSAPLSITETQTNVNCFGEATGAIKIKITGGTAPYTYSWSNGLTTEDIKNLIAGNYTVNITDANGCAVSKTITITQPSLPLIITENHTNVSCFGGADATINISVSGGKSPYTYSWSNGSSTKDLSALAVGNYNLTVKDANNCSSVITVAVDQPLAPLKLTEVHQDIVCFGDTAGSIILTVNGGTAPYTFLWNNNAVSKDLSGLIAGIYSVVITDAKGCTIGKQIQINQPAAPLTISETHQNINCFGEQTGSISINALGGTAPYTYSWVNGGTLQNLVNLSAGIYQAKVTDKNGCTAVKQIHIIQPNAPLTVSETHINNSCFGDKIAKIDVTVNGGTAPYTYLWNNGQTTQDLNNLGSGNYLLTVTDKNNCSQIINVSISPTQPFVIVETVQNVKCYNGNSGSISLSLSGGKAPYTVTWLIGASGQQINNLAAGNYTYKAEDAFGCTLQKTITITQPAPLTAILNITNTSCKFTSDGAIEAVISGGIKPYSISWDDANGGIKTFVNNQKAGRHTIRIVDANNCSVLLYGIVLEGNCAPIADDDLYSTMEDTPITINTPGLTVNDNDPDQDLIKISLNTVKDPGTMQGTTSGNNITFSTMNGKVTLNNEGSFTYTPNKNFYGKEKFVYKVSDGDLLSNFATVFIDVLAVNDPPIANDDKFITPEDIPVNGSVVANDSDPDADPLIYSLVTAPIQGVLTFNADGSFRYVPPIHFIGIITFSYQVCDPSGACDQANVTITVTPVNDPPIAGDDKFNTEINKPVSQRVTDNDSDPDLDPLQFSALTQPTNGTLIFNANGTFVYQPNLGFNGIDSFTYQACDPLGLCDNATVTILVQPLVTVNLTPSTGVIKEGGKISITAILTQSLLEDVTITLAFNGTATPSLDYALTGNYVSILIPAGQTATIQEFTVNAINDALQDFGEQVEASITTTSSTFVLIGTGSKILITDIYPVNIPTTPDENPDINPDPLVSPNQDGQGNERFIIYNISKYPNNEVLIFNRWGNEVYKIKGYNNDDKAFNGFANVGILTNSNKELVDGVYYYIIYTTQNNAKKLNKGYLILKR